MMGCFKNGDTSLGHSETRIEGQQSHLKWGGRMGGGYNEAKHYVILHTCCRRRSYRRYPLTASTTAVMTPVRTVSHLIKDDAGDDTGEDNAGDS